MDTQTILDRIQKQKEKKELQKNFKYYKKYVNKLYPNSVLKISDKNKFYIVNENGFRILRDEYSIPDCDSVFETWKKTYELLWSEHIIDRNNKKFSDERLINFKSKNKIIKE